MWKAFVAGVILVGVAVASLAVGGEYAARQSDFCGGTCHAMAEPYDTWKASKHRTGERTVACNECHYPPGEDSAPGSGFNGLKQLASYLSGDHFKVRKGANVSSQSCATAGCHAGKAFEGKEIRFQDKIIFKHKSHGQDLQCVSCHVKNSPDRHFEVPKEICFLCHFEKTKVNDGRNRCTLCHVLPTKSLQKQKSKDDPDAKPITHQTLVEAKVGCPSCHYRPAGHGGEIEKEVCRNCHWKTREWLVANAEGKLVGGRDERKQMHDLHVVSPQAGCFDCHRPVDHKAQASDFLEPARRDCAACHPDHHRYQKVLLEGAARDGIAKTPSLMMGSRTNCTGCHIGETHKKGEKVLTGSAKACIGCHSESQGKMADDWKNTVVKEVKFAKELEQEAIDALAAAVGKAPEEKRSKARALFDRGLASLHIVEFGNGVHNKKFSIMLLDAAMNDFEDAVDILN